MVVRLSAKERFALIILGTAVMIKLFHLFWS